MDTNEATTSRSRRPFNEAKVRKIGDDPVNDILGVSEADRQGLGETTMTGL